MMRERIRETERAREREKGEAIIKSLRIAAWEEKIQSEQNTESCGGGRGGKG